MRVRVRVLNKIVVEEIGTDDGYHAWMENIGGCGELVGVVDGWERWMGGCFERVERMWK